MQNKVIFKKDIDGVTKGTEGTVISKGYSFTKKEGFYIIQLLDGVKLETVKVFESDFNKLIIE